MIPVERTTQPESGSERAKKTSFAYLRQENAHLSIGRKRKLRDQIII